MGVFRGVPPLSQQVLLDVEKEGNCKWMSTGVFNLVVP